MDDCSAMDVTTMDGDPDQDADRSSTHSSKDGRTSAAPVLIRGASNPPVHASDGLLVVREQLRERGISAEGAEILLASWKPGTRRQYHPHIKRWAQYCDRRHVDSLNPNVSNIINFLSDVFHRELGYESVNTARSALSSLGIVVNGCTAGSHPLVVRFMKGVFNLRPSLPRYTETWDVQPVLRVLRGMFPLQSLSFKDLTLKLVMLMALTQAARVQTLHLLGIPIQVDKQDSISVPLCGAIKQCRQNFNVRVIQFRAFPQDNSLCVCTTLHHYLDRTSGLRQVTLCENAKLLISFVKPHRPVSGSTIARWIKTIMCRSGVDTGKFTAGSVRQAAASRAKAASVPISCIMAKAGWSRERTFAKFYDKTIVEAGDPFQDAVLA